MAGNIVTFLVGVICIVLGISNMKGNISSLHSYHRNRVSEEDRDPLRKPCFYDMSVTMRCCLSYLRYQEQCI